MCIKRGVCRIAYFACIIACFHSIPCSQHKQFLSRTQLQAYVGSLFNISSHLNHAFSSLCYRQTSQANIGEWAPCASLSTNTTNLYIVADTSTAVRAFTMAFVPQISHATLPCMFSLPFIGDRSAFLFKVLLYPSDMSTRFISHSLTRANAPCTTVTECCKNQGSGNAFLECEPEGPRCQ